MGSTDHRIHVAFLAFPFGTHAAPLQTLARHLASASPNSTFSFFATTMSNFPFTKIPSPPNLRFYDVFDGAPVVVNPMEEIELFLKATPGNFRDGMEVAVGDGSGEVTCVVSDSFLWFAGKLAAEMGVPWVAVWTGGPCSLSAHVYTDEIRKIFGTGGQENGDCCLDFIPGLSAMRIRDLPEGVVFGGLNSPFSDLLHRSGREMSHADAVVLNTFEGLEPGVLSSDLKIKFKSCLPIGPLNLVNPSDSSLVHDHFNSLPWLDRQAPNSVAYIGFGTVMSLPPVELTAVANALETTGFPFLWSLKDVFRAQLPIGFLNRTANRGLVVPWTPQVAVLSHDSVGVFMTHCGWNSVMESITGGVPMICRPFLGDQRLNAREASDVWGVGLVVEGDGSPTEDWVKKALNLVLRSDDGKKMRERARKMKEMAIAAVGHGGSSSENLRALVRLITGGERSAKGPLDNNMLT